MFTLGIPNSQQRRANSVLTHDRSTPVDYDFHKQDDDFHIFTFDVDYDGFHDIVLLLKSNGISTIGADEQLTDRNIMKLTDLLEQNQNDTISGMEDSPSQGFGNDNKITSIEQVVRALDSILKTWETKEYNSPTERYEEYFMDIDEFKKELEQARDASDPRANMTDDEKEDFYTDLEDVSDIMETFKLKDFFTEQEKNRIDKRTTSTDFDVKIEIPGIEGETKVNIKLGHATGPFEDVTISWEDESYNVSFEEEEMIEDHGNEGQDWVFLAKHKESETEFRVDVAVEADYEQSGNIQEVDWDTLQVEFDQETESLDEQGCSEQEIEEGTCGYGVDGKLGDEPAGPSLLSLVRESIKMLKKQ